MLLTSFQFDIHEICQQRHRFHALFNVYVAWDESVDNIHKPTETEAERGKWVKEFFKPKDKKWDIFDPQLRFTNCVEWNKDEHEEWYRVVSYGERNGGNCEPYKMLSVQDK